MTITWRQLQDKISQMSQEQLEQEVLLWDCEGWSPATDLKFMTEDEVALYYKMWGPYDQDPTQVGTPFLNSDC